MQKPGSFHGDMPPAYPVVPDRSDCREVAHASNAFAVEVFKVQGELLAKLLAHVRNYPRGIICAGPL
jgi:hypothetical protein